MRKFVVLFSLSALFALSVFASDGGIHEAVQRTDTERVRELVAGDPSLLESRDRSGRTPFHLAIMKSDPALWELLATPELLDEPDSLRLRPIFLAITSSRPEALDWLIEQGADIQSPKPGDGQTPLHWASELGRAEHVRSLLAAGAAVDAPNLVGSTPLLVAAKLGSAEAARLLLEAGADPNAANAVGLTPLMIAALRDYREIASLLLAGGAEAGSKDRRGKTAREYAIEKGYQEMAVILASAEAQGAGSTGTSDQNR